MYAFCIFSFSNHNQFHLICLYLFCIFSFSYFLISSDLSLSLTLPARQHGAKQNKFHLILDVNSPKSRDYRWSGIINHILLSNWCFTPLSLWLKLFFCHWRRSWLNLFFRHFSSSSSSFSRSATHSRPENWTQLIFANNFIV